MTTYEITFYQGRIISTLIAFSPEQRDEIVAGLIDFSYDADDIDVVEVVR